MLFHWDPIKADRNLVKHGVAFELAQTVFDDPLHLSILDTKAHAEERWITVGRGLADTLLVVVHTYVVSQSGVERIRIISARQATKKEKIQYEEGI